MATQPPHIPFLSAMTDQEQFLLAISEHPDDDHPRLVCADSGLRELLASPLFSKLQSLDLTSTGLTPAGLQMLALRVDARSPIVRKMRC
jgi:hypothetical protein